MDGIRCANGRLSEFLWFSFCMFIILVINKILHFCLTICCIYSFNICLSLFDCAFLLCILSNSFVDHVKKKWSSDTENKTVQCACTLCSLKYGTIVPLAEFWIYWSHFFLFLCSPLPLQSITKCRRKWTEFGDISWMLSLLHPQLLLRRKERFLMNTFKSWIINNITDRN